MSIVVLSEDLFQEALPSKYDTGEPHRGLTNFHEILTCAGYLDYPFPNKRVKICVENLTHNVEKKEKNGVVVILNAFLARISKVASTGEYHTRRT